jgi:hypothetical protein
VAALREPKADVRVGDPLKSRGLIHGVEHHHLPVRSPPGARFASKTDGRKRHYNGGLTLNQTATESG